MQDKRNLILTSSDPDTGEVEWEGGITYTFKRISPNQVNIIKSEEFTLPSHYTYNLLTAKTFYEDLISGGPSGYHTYTVTGGDAEDFFKE